MNASGQNIAHHSACYCPSVSQRERWPHQVGGRDELQRPVPWVDDPERFHEGWEARTFALAQSIDALYPTDRFRHAIERLDSGQYAELTYFEKWLAAVEHLVVSEGHVTAAELEAAQRRRLAEHDHVHAHEHEEPRITPHPREHLAAPAVDERFGVGDPVTLAAGLGEHHRLPDWARGRRGVVRAVRGSFPLPDLVVAEAENAERRYALYAVEVAARDAFPDAGAADLLFLDVYDPYLEPAR